MRFKKLDEWLAWQETLHPSTIELGLDRVLSVYKALQNQTTLPVVITVAGTNGKGSTLAMLEAILLADGYRVGKYISPHLYRYNERVQINAQAVDDQSLCHAFERIDQARRDTSLTYFEFGTLAALDIFHHADLDVVLLETGLGGRLDAVNIIDSDVSIITSIDLDHTDWLGATRELIGHEKFGIARPGKPCIVGELQPPQAVLDKASASGVQLMLAGQTFSCALPAAGQGNGWHFINSDSRIELPLPALRGEHQIRNASCVVMCIQCLREKLGVSMASIRTGLAGVSLAGRFEVRTEKGITCVQDVAHNPAAAAALAQALLNMPTPGVRRAVFGAMADKDLVGLLTPMRALIDHWYLAPLEMPRAATVEQIRNVLVNIGVERSQIHCMEEMADAKQQALQNSQQYDQVVVFGSFFTLEAAEYSAANVIN